MIEINNLTQKKLDKTFLKRVARKVLQGENKKIELSIALVGQEKIRELNRKYRKKNKATDVLSFRYDEKTGEIVICPQKTKELPRALIHGILHILGHSHKTMKEKEIRYLS